MSMFARGLAGWLVLALAAGSAAAQGQDPKQESADPAQQADIRTLVTAVDEVAAGKPAPDELPVTWAQHHFIKSQGDRTYVPFTITVDPAAFTTPTPVGLYLRVAKRDGAATAASSTGAGEKPSSDKPTPETRPQYAFEDVFFFDAPAAEAGKPNVFRRAFAVPAGDYDIYIALKDRGTGTPAEGAKADPGASEPAATEKTPPETSSSEAPAPGAAPAAPRMGVLKHEITVPSFAEGELQTSSIIVAQAAEVLQQAMSNERQAENPYTFGQMRIVPSLDNTFTKANELSVIFWIYNASLDEATKKPNLQVNFEFHQKAGDGEKYFNKTEPQLLNAETLPAQFDLEAGHQLPGSLAVPLTSFPEGDYRLAITVEDKVAGTSIGRDVNFTIVPAQQPQQP